MKSILVKILLIKINLGFDKIEIGYPIKLSHFQ